MKSSISSSGNSTGTRAFRSSFLHCVSDPVDNAGDQGWVYLEDGLLLIRDGKVEMLDHTDSVLPQLSDDIPVEDYRGKLIVPGFVDTHIHYPQTDMIASHGEQLLDWLEKYTFPTERRFADINYANDVAEFFTDELIRNGTTSALVLGTVHQHSVDAIFNSALRYNLRLVAGKVLMDRNCPDDLRDSPDIAYNESKALIERWHGQSRLSYAITPRFAPTSTDAQLVKMGQLAQEHPDVFVHTHVAENTSEVDWVKQLFPKSRSYLDVYDQYGLLRDRAVLAHCIYLDEPDRMRLADSGAAMSFCPTSNLFLGSGLFDFSAAKDCNARVGLGTDVGAGTSFSMLQTLAEAYKVAQLAGRPMSAHELLYLATLGSAKSLYLDDKIGNFEQNKEADFVVLDWAATELLKRRSDAANDIAEKFFAMVMLGDDRAVFATHIMGNCVYTRD